MAVIERDPKQHFEMPLPEDEQAEDQIEARLWYGIEFEVDLSPNSRLLTVRPRLARERGRSDLDPATLLDRASSDAPLPFPLSGDDMEVLTAVARYRPLVHRTKGYVVSHADWPELLAELRTKACVVESPRTAATPVETAPIFRIGLKDGDGRGSPQLRIPGSSPLVQKLKRGIGIQTRQDPAGQAAGQVVFRRH